jgi:hypothetical protein
MHPHSSQPTPPADSTRYEDADSAATPAQAQRRPDLGTARPARKATRLTEAAARATYHGEAVSVSESTNSTKPSNGQKRRITVPRRCAALDRICGGGDASATAAPTTAAMITVAVAGRHSWSRGNRPTIRLARLTRRMVRSAAARKRINHTNKVAASTPNTTVNPLSNTVANRFFLAHARGSISLAGGLAEALSSVVIA